MIFLAGENPDDVRTRMIGTMEFYGIDRDACRVHFVAGTFSIRNDLERLKAESDNMPNLVLVVVDTFAAYFDSDDENSNAQALDFTRVIRRVAAFDAKPAVIMPAHPVKNATRGNLTPKGGSSLLNEVDGNRFGVNIIPHTAARTTFGTLRKGDNVNLEVDLLARYVARLHSDMTAA